MTDRQGGGNSARKRPSTQAAGPASLALEQLRLRELGPADAHRCAQLERELFANEGPWTEADFRAEFASAHTFYLGVEGGEPRIGQASGARSSWVCRFGAIGAE